MVTERRHIVILLPRQNDHLVTLNVFGALYWCDRNVRSSRSLCNLSHRPIVTGHFWSDHLAPLPFQFLFSSRISCFFCLQQEQIVRVQACTGCFRHFSYSTNRWISTDSSMKKQTRVRQKAPVASEYLCKGLCGRWVVENAVLLRSWRRRRMLRPRLHHPGGVRRIGHGMLQPEPQLLLRVLFVLDRVVWHVPRGLQHLPALLRRLRRRLRVHRRSVLVLRRLLRLLRRLRQQLLPVLLPVLLGLRPQAQRRRGTAA